MVQMIRKYIFKDLDRCLMAEAKDSERCHRNLFDGKSELIRIDALCGFDSTLFGYNIICSDVGMRRFHGDVQFVKIN